MSTRFALILVALIAGAALAGCGLSPVYGDYANGGRNSPVAAAMDNVYIDSIPDRHGQKLRNILMDRMYKSGRAHRADSAYRLHMGIITETIYGLGIAKDATATRSQIKLATTMTLSRANDPRGEPLIRRNLTAVSSFNTLASQYTTLVTEEDARNQTITDLGEQIVTILELYFSNPAAFPAPTEAAAPVTDESDREHMRDPMRPIDDYY